MGNGFENISTRLNRAKSVHNINNVVHNSNEINRFHCIYIFMQISVLTVLSKILEAIIGTEILRGLLINQKLNYQKEIQILKYAFG